MTVRDLDEMRAFKNSEARLIARAEAGSEIDKIICDMGLKQLRAIHSDYIKGDAVLQLVLGEPGILRADEVRATRDQLFDYADLDFEAEPQKEGDS